MITHDLRVRDGFEGNAQTFRVVTKLSVRYREHPGQDLTRATLNAILKYPWKRGRNGFRHKKYGAYSLEGTDFARARAIQLPAARSEKSAEAEIMDWADDIAYAVHDVEDFYRAGFVPLDRLMDEDADELELFISGTFDRWKLEKFRPVRKHTDAQLREAFTNLMEQLRNTQRIAEPYTGTREQRARLRSLTSLLISGYVQAIRLRKPDKANSRTVAIKPEAEREITMLKQLTWYYVIHRPSLAAQQRGQERVVHDLFNIFYEATESLASRDLLPIGARQFLEDALKRTPGRRRRGRRARRQNVKSIRARVAADVVCSLSEQQAIALHQRLTGVDPGSVLYGIFP